MNKYLKIVIPVLLAGGCLAVLLVALDGMARAEPLAWTDAAPIPMPRVANLVQCPDDPDGFYLVGGVTTGNITVDTLYHYDAVSDMWNVKLAPMPEPRRAVGAACYEGKIYIAGGYYLGIIKDTFYIYDIASDSWSIGLSLPDALWAAGLGAWDGKLYLVGGAYFDETPVDRVDVFDLASGVWTAGGGTPMPTASVFYGAVQRGPYLYAVGGFSGDNNNNVDQTQRYDMSSDSWDIGPEFTSQRALLGISMTGAHLYAQGGDLNGGGNGDLTDLVEYLDLSVWPGGAWTDLGDPLPEATIYPAGACTEAISGGEIWAVGGVLAGLQFTDANLYRPAEACHDFYFGNLAPENLGEGGFPGESVTYTLSLVNDGTLTDTYDISSSAVWTTTLPSMIGPLAPGGSADMLVSVEVPNEATLGDWDTAVITATSQGDPLYSDNSMLTTTALGYDLDLSPDWERSGYPGEMVTYTLQISNTGNVTDMYDLTFSGNIWEVHLPVTTTTLRAGEMAEVIVHVTVKLEAVHGDSDMVTLTATSQGDPGVQDMSMLTTTAIWHSTYLPLIERQPNE